MGDRGNRTDPVTDEISRAVQQYEELVDAGDSPSLDEFCARYPEIEPGLRRELEIHALLEATSADRISIGVGDTLGSHQLVEEIGRGGMGVVFRARDQELDRDVAIKVVAIDPLRAERAERFLREAKAMARIRHPHVVEVYSFGRSGQLIYLVMELLQASLSDHVGLSVEPRQVATWIGEAARGVAYCHQRGIVHRDLKPANLLLDSDGVVKVADFGIARIEDMPALTRTGHAWGTRGYTAPEALAGDEADARVDVFGLGVCMYALLAGVGPNADGALEHLNRLPRRLRKVVAIATAANANERYSDLDSLVAALESANISEAPRRRWWIRMGAVAIPVAVAATLTWMRTRESPKKSATTSPPTDQPATAPQVPGGYIVDGYHHWFRTASEPTKAARDPGAGPIIPSRLWEQKLGELSKARQLSRAQSVAFEQGTTTYVAEIARASDAITLRVRAGDELRARVRLPAADLGGIDGWGIFHETTDEDGDGRKDITLVRVTEQVAAVRVVKLDPQAWKDATGWRLTSRVAAAFHAPVTLDDGSVAVAWSVRAPGQPWSVALQLRDGKTGRLLRSVPMPGVDPVGPRMLDDRIRARLGVGLHWSVDTGTYRWQWGKRPRVAAWSAILDDQSLRLVAIGGKSAAALAIAPPSLTTATSQYFRARVAAASDVIESRAGHLCFVAGGTLRCLDGGRVSREVQLPSGFQPLWPATELQSGALALAGSERVVLVEASGTIREHAMPGINPRGPVVEMPDGCLLITARHGLHCAGGRRLVGVPPRRGWTTAPTVLRGGGRTLLLLTASGDRGRIVTIIDPKTSADEHRPLWQFAAATVIADRPAVSLHGGSLRVYFNDRVGTLYGVAPRLPDGLAIERVQ